MNSTIPTMSITSCAMLFSFVAQWSPQQMKAPRLGGRGWGGLAFGSRCGCYELLGRDRLVHMAELHDDRRGQERLIHGLNFREMVPVELLGMALVMPE